MNADLSYLTTTYADQKKIEEFNTPYVPKRGGGEMILNKEKQEEFEKAVEPLIKFLCDNFHPHVSVIVDCSSAELLEGICSIRTDKFIKA